MLNIVKSTDNGKANFVLSGRLDTTTAPQLEQEIKASLQGINELVFDIKELEYVSSAGLRVFLSAQKIMNTQGKMKLLNANAAVMEIFDITGFSDILTIE